MSEHLRVREIDDDEGPAAGADRPAGQRVGGDLAADADGLLSAQGMRVAAIVKVAFTSEDRVRDVICNFSADGFAWL